jgi:hypothetical protein
MRREAQDPTDVALKRIADMIGRGADASRIQREAAALISSWSATLDAEDMRERLDSLREQLAEGVEAAEEQAGEMDGDKAFARSLSAMCAARDAFARAAGTMA